MKIDGHTARDIAKYLGVSRATLYRYLAHMNGDGAARTGIVAKGQRRYWNSLTAPRASSLTSTSADSTGWSTKPEAEVASHTRLLFN
jgi:transposase